jgi:cell division protease FtsH
MGHALVGHFLPNANPVHKISVIARGQALGVTVSMPTEDKFTTTKAEFEDQMAMLLGGRSAEEIVFDEITTGASNDLERVTQIAKSMTMRFGMSDKLGPRVLGHNHGAPFLGRDMHSEPDYSDEMAREIDAEISRIIESAHVRARSILEERREQLDTLSEILLRRETIEREEFLGLLDGQAEDDVFRAKDEREAQARAEAERELNEEERVKPATPPPTTGPAVPES